MIAECGYCAKRYSGGKACLKCQAGFWVLRRTQHCKREFVTKTLGRVPVQVRTEDYGKHKTHNFLIPASVLQAHFDIPFPELLALDIQGKVLPILEKYASQWSNRAKTHFVHCFQCQNPFLGDATLRTLGQVVAFEKLLDYYNIKKISPIAPLVRPVLNNSLFCSISCETQWKERSNSQRCSACQTVFVVTDKPVHTKGFCSKECLKDNDKYKPCMACKKPFMISIKARMARKKGRKVNEHVFQGFCSRTCLKEKSAAKPWEPEALEQKSKIFAFYCAKKHKVRFPETHRGLYTYCESCQLRVACPA